MNYAKLRITGTAIIATLLAAPLTAQHVVEPKLNEEAIRNIKFDFTPPTVETPDYKKPQEAPLDKDYMGYRVDLKLPRSLADTFRVKKPSGFVRLEPYTIWTSFGEDPIYDVLFTGKDKQWEIHWTINIKGDREEYGRYMRPSAGYFYDFATGSAGIGTTITFDLDKLLYETFTRRGRAIRRNRSHATAYKTYVAYVPTISDNSKFPHYAVPKDTVNLHVKQDEESLQRQDDSKKVRYHKPADIPKTTFGSKERKVTDENYNRLIDERRRQDSIQRHDYLRRDKVNQNAYDIDLQIRKIKEKR